MKRTGSIGSCVGPAVTRILRPSSAPARAEIYRKVQPPHARQSRRAPACVRGRIRRRPCRRRPVAKRQCHRRPIGQDCVCGAGVHMRTFMAGAIITGLSVASRVVLAKSLAVPCAMRAMISAVAGATRIRSASRDSWMWPISASSVRSKGFHRRGRPIRSPAKAGRQIGRRPMSANSARRARDRASGARVPALYRRRCRRQ